MAAAAVIAGSSGRSMKPRNRSRRPARRGARSVRAPRFASSAAEGKPSAAQASSSAAKSWSISGRTARSSRASSVSDSVIEGPPQLFECSVQAGAGVALADPGHGRDLGVREPGEVLERDQLAVAAVELIQRLAQCGALDRDLGGVPAAGARGRGRSSSGWGRGRIRGHAPMRDLRRSSSSAALRAMPNSQARGEPRSGSSCRLRRQARSKAWAVTSSAAERSRSSPATYANRSSRLSR